jgi:hypothetical protein
MCAQPNFRQLLGLWGEKRFSSKKQRQSLICHVGERTLRTWWEANEGQAAPAITHDISQIDVCPDLPAAAQARIRILLRQHEGVFEGRQGLQQVCIQGGDSTFAVCIQGSSF